MAQARKNSVRNLRYGPRTRLVRGIYYQLIIKITVFEKRRIASYERKGKFVLFIFIYLLKD